MAEALSSSNFQISGTISSNITITITTITRELMHVQKHKLGMPGQWLNKLPEKADSIEILSCVCLHINISLSTES